MVEDSCVHVDAGACKILSLTIETKPGFPFTDHEPGVRAWPSLSALCALFLLRHCEAGPPFLPAKEPSNHSTNNADDASATDQELPGRDI